MNIDKTTRLRLQFLTRVVVKERDHLLITDQRLFQLSFNLERVLEMDTNIDLSERVDAFVARFSRLQDTVGDKLIPLILMVLGEKVESVIDNLDRVEKLGLLDSADEWMSIRNLRNQMIHEYIEDPLILLSALQSGHDYVPTLVKAVNNFLSEVERRLD